MENPKNNKMGVPKKSTPTPNIDCTATTNNIIAVRPMADSGSRLSEVRQTNISGIV
jgi:hypothetical protein